MNDPDIITEADLDAASRRLLSAALQQAFDDIIAKEGKDAPNAIGRALVAVAGRKNSTQETTAT